MELTPELIADLRKVIDYSWEDEEADYNREGLAGNDIFPALLRLRIALPDDDDAPPGRLPGSVQPQQPQPLLQHDGRYAVTNNPHRVVIELAPSNGSSTKSHAHVADIISRRVAGYLGDDRLVISVRIETPKESRP